MYPLPTPSPRQQGGMAHFCSACAMASTPFIRKIFVPWVERRSDIHSWTSARSNCTANTRTHTGTATVTNRRQRHANHRGKGNGATRECVCEGEGLAQQQARGANDGVKAAARQSPRAPRCRSHARALSYAQRTVRTSPGMCKPKELMLLSCTCSPPVFKNSARTRAAAGVDMLEAPWHRQFGARAWVREHEHGQRTRRHTRMHAGGHARARTGTRRHRRLCPSRRAHRGPSRASAPGRSRGCGARCPGPPAAHPTHPHSLRVGDLAVGGAKCGTERGE